MAPTALISYATCDPDDRLHVRHAVREALDAWGIRTEDGGDGVLFVEGAAADVEVALAGQSVTTATTTVCSPSGGAGETFIPAAEKEEPMALTQVPHL